MTCMHITYLYVCLFLIPLCMCSHLCISVYTSYVGVYYYCSINWCDHIQPYVSSEASTDMCVNLSMFLPSLIYGMKPLFKWRLILICCTAVNMTSKTGNTLDNIKIILVFCLFCQILAGYGLRFCFLFNWDKHKFE